MWYTFPEIVLFLSKPLTARTMTNEQFRAYIDEKLEWIRKTIVSPDASPEDKRKAHEAESFYVSAAKMARHCSGPAFRRFRRDFERRRKL